MTFETLATDPAAELYCATCEAHYQTGELCPVDGTRLVRLGASVDPMLGRDLDGRYTIVEKLGQGGMGAVYRAKQHSMGREVAVKVVTPSLTSDTAAVKRFLREAKLASRLAHPNIVSVLDFGQTKDGLFYLVMELVQGRTLHDVCSTEGRLDLARLVRIGVQICDALEGAHALPIIHRDLKPANVMLLAHGRDLVKVLDFGLAKSLSPDSSTGNTMTSHGALLGTPTFMPPEVANGEPFIDGRADLYSLGCMLFLMGTGRTPFVTDSIPEMIAMHGTEPAPRMTGVPSAIADVVERLLRKDPAERYPTAAALRLALEEAYEQTRRGGGVDATLDEVVDGARESTTAIYQAPAMTGTVRPSATPLPTVHVARRGGPLVVLAALGVIAAALGIVLVTRSSGPRPERAPAAPPSPIVTPIETPPIDAAPPLDAAPEPPDAAATVPDAGPKPSTRPRPRPETARPQPVTTPAPVDAGVATPSEAPF